MRTIFFLLQKEFLQILRNKTMIPIIFIAPVIQLLILSNAATFDIKKVKITTLDNDKSNTSRELLSHFSSTQFFDLLKYSSSYREAEDLLKSNSVKMVIIIPSGTERAIYRNEPAEIQFVINAEDGAAAGIIHGYSSGILAEFNRNLLIKTISLNPPDPGSQPKAIEVLSSFWYNPLLNYKTFMIPGILVLLVTMIGLFLSGMNIVREKEIGTIEQLNVTPILKYHFIIGKLLPFWLIALFDLGLGLLVARLVFDIPITGSVSLIFLFAGVYLLVVLGIGLFVSTVSETQQQAMFIAWFIMMVFMLLSGLFTSIDNMPGWVQTITLFNPISYFIEVMRKIMLKGSGFYDLQKQFYILVLYAFVMIFLSVMRYRKVS